MFLAKLFCAICATAAYRNQTSTPNKALCPRRINNSASQSVHHQVNLLGFRRVAIEKTHGREMRMKRRLPMSRGMTLTILTGALLMTTLAQTGATPQLGSTTKTSFGKTPGAQPVDLYRLTNKSGAQASITNYGGTVVSLKMPDRNAKLADVVLGYDTVEGYVSDKAYFGAPVGRYGNRNAHAPFMLHPKPPPLSKTNAD